MDRFHAMTVFAKVVEQGSFVRAAESLNVTQSTVSARIKELEARLGQPLFVRRKSGVTLTTAGKCFQPHAATLLRVVQQARQDTLCLPTRKPCSISAANTVCGRESY